MLVLQERRRRVRARRNEQEVKNCQQPWSAQEKWWTFSSFFPEPDRVSFGVQRIGTQAGRAPHAVGHVTCAFAELHSVRTPNCLSQRLIWLFAACPHGRHGKNCAELCECHGQPCDPETGTCVCGAGSVGSDCSQCKCSSDTPYLL